MKEFLVLVAIFVVSLAGLLAIGLAPVWAVVIAFVLTLVGVVVIAIQPSGGGWGDL